MSSKDREQIQTDDNKAIGQHVILSFSDFGISFTRYPQQLELHESSYNPLKFALLNWFVCKFLKCYSSESNHSLSKINYFNQICFGVLVVRTQLTAIYQLKCFDNLRDFETKTFSTTF